MFVETTFCIDLLRETRHGGGPATRKLRELGETPLLASLFVLCELHAGARLSVDPERELRSLELLAENLTIVYPDEDFAVAYAEMEVALRRLGTPIPTMDLMIATAAKMRGLPLITRDSGHYARIPGLVVETY
jgi:predicted nucleic acid-binding protein